MSVDHASHVPADGELVTRIESVAAISRMVRCSFGTIAFLRGFCDESCFANTKFGSLPVMIVVPSANEPEAEKLAEWVEGVIHAFKEEYIDRVSLLVHESIGNRKVLVESYTFGFSFGSHDEIPVVHGMLNHSHNESQIEKEYVNVSSQRDHGAQSAPYSLSALLALNSRESEQPRAGAVLMTKKELRKGLCNIVDELISVTHALPPPSADRVLSMRVSHTPNAPSDYQPPCFKPLSAQKALVQLQMERQLDGITGAESSCGDLLASSHHKLQFGIRCQRAEQSLKQYNASESVLLFDSQASPVIDAGAPISAIAAFGYNPSQNTIPATPNALVAPSCVLAQISPINTRKRTRKHDVNKESFTQD